jgi:transmembrane sensor
MSKIDDEALDWVARQATRNLDSQEQAAFDAWFTANPRHQGAYLRAQAIQHSLDQVTVQANLKPRTDARAPRAQAADTEPEAPAHDARNGSLHMRRGRRGFVVGGALAAGLAALAATSLRPRPADRTVLATAQGEFRKVPLADHSTVSMNSGSELAVEMLPNERRIVLAKGEAWFEVAKDKSRPFIVSAGDVHVRAVGTAFSVRRAGSRSEVVVTEGVVEVWSDKNRAVRKRLTAGGLAFVDDKTADIVLANDRDEIARKLAWRDGRLVFNNQTLPDAIADFNRYNARQIVLADPALRRKTVVGQYRLDQPEAFANDVRTLFRVPVTVGADRITIGTEENRPTANRQGGAR